MSDPIQNVSSSDPKRELLRHTVATVAYRGGKAVRSAPAGFANFQAGEGTRTPGQILAHIGDLFDWALSIVMGQRTWHDSTPLPWQQEVERFFAALKKFDDYLASSEPVHASIEKVFQGPVADALTHGPVKGESYYIMRRRSKRAESAPTRPSRSASSEGWTLVNYFARLR